ncbi:MAG: hypothetical protein PGN15_03790 [Aeromicrobium erythreum]
MSLLINQQPTPSGTPVPLAQPRPVWVGCLWDHGGEQVKELVPAVATHTYESLVLCDFWDPRTGANRLHWMEREFVRDRPTSIAPPKRPTSDHPAAAPSPKFDVGS